MAGLTVLIEFCICPLSLVSCWFQGIARMVCCECLFVCGVSYAFWFDLSCTRRIWLLVVCPRSFSMAVLRLVLNLVCTFRLS